MHSDGLVPLLLFLRRHGRLSAAALARELEASTRTVLRDVEARSAAAAYPAHTESPAQRIVTR
ncbi:putative DNA-binding transcriptional regulator YafY [Actinomadura rupiterrae]|nr:putative DNA-binding transcriptional regulator YafY [Actinomadura rupiterrae]